MYYNEIRRKILEYNRKEIHKKNIRKAAIVGLSVIMAVAGSTAVFAAEATSYMQAGGYRIKVRYGTKYDNNPEYCFTAVDSSNVVDIQISGKGYCIHGSHSFSDYADQSYGLLAGAHCGYDFDGVESTVQIWTEDDSNTESFSCWK